MKSICFGCFDDRIWEVTSDRAQNAFECFANDDVLRRNGHSVDEEPLRTARISRILRRMNGLTERKLRAARLAAEFAAWQASGGDFLRSSLAEPNFVELREDCKITIPRKS